MTKIKSFKDLRIWQDAQKLIECIYKTTETFPNKEQFGLIDQLRRAAVSVSSNIAEGKGRETTKEYIRFLIIARGSVQEIISQLNVAKRLQYTNSTILDDISERYENLGSSINALINSLSSFLKKQLPSPNTQNPTPSPIEYTPKDSETFRS